MYKRGNKEYLLDIYNACNQILKYTKGINKREFMENEEKQDAIVRNLEILGEAVKNISETFREKHPEVQWKEIARTRDKLIHFYFGVDYDVVWDIITVDIPRLKKQVKIIIEKE
ncbi:MAG: DUF86 domain-containing protein, partial [Methanosarcinales archaeon]